jgi:cytochrome P450
MFMAGHETTAQTMSWLFYHLAGDVEIYRQVKAEGAKMLQGELAGLEDLRQLTFTTQVISEALRKYPPIWAIVRKPFIDDQMNGISIPSSTNVLINLYGMHHHPAYWQTPHQFNPAHFDLSKKQQPPPYVYLPFGGGPRICIGSNFAMTVMQLVLSRLTQTIQFNIPKNYAPAVEPNITLRAKGGIRLIINHNAV